MIIDNKPKNPVARLLRVDRKLGTRDRDVIIYFLLYIKRFYSGSVPYNNGNNNENNIIFIYMGIPWLPVYRESSHRRSKNRSRGVTLSKRKYFQLFGSREILMFLLISRRFTGLKMYKNTCVHIYE